MSQTAQAPRATLQALYLNEVLLLHEGELLDYHTEDTIEHAAIESLGGTTQEVPFQTHRTWFLAVQTAHADIAVLRAHMEAFPVSQAPVRCSITMPHQAAPLLLRGVMTGPYLLERRGTHVFLRFQFRHSVFCTS